MVLQSFLAREGALDKAAGWDHHDDGLFGPKTKKALRSFLELHGYDVGKSGGWCGWPRQSVKAMQMWAKDQGADPGPIDGCWGRRTSKAMQIALNSLRGKEGSTSMPVKVEPSAVLHAFSASNDKEPLVAAGVPLLLGVPAPKAASAA